MTHHMPPMTVHAADMGALALMLTSWAGALPAIAAGIAAIWYLVQLYDRFFGR
jgi:hypothetical protein